MKKLRQQIDFVFESVARRCYQHPRKVIFLVLLMVAGLCTQLPKITVDTSTEGLLHADDPALLTYHDFRGRFGRDQLLVIAVRSPDIFNLRFLEQLKAMHLDLEREVPHIEEITSLINARNTRGEQDRLIVEDLFDDWPQTPEALARIKKRAVENPMYKNTLIAADGTLTAIIIKTDNYTGQQNELDLGAFDEDPQQAEDIGGISSEPTPYFTEKENSQTVKAVFAVLQKYRQQGLDIYVSGSSGVTYSLARSLVRDTALFLGLSFVTIALILLAMFRNLSGVMIPLFIVGLTMISTVGLMAMCAIPIKLPTQVLPSFISAVGVCYAVHILALFYAHFPQGGDKQNAVVYAVGHSGLPVAMTAATTAGGLLAFLSADVAPIANVGLFASVGVLLAFGFTMTLIPPLLALFPIKLQTVARSRSNRPLTTILTYISKLVSAHPYAVLTVSFIVIGVCMAGLPKLRFSHNVIEWLPANDPLRVSTETIDAKFNGSFNLEVIIDTGQENGLYDPSILNRLETTVAELENLTVGEIYVGKAWSLTTILKEINQALHQGQTEHYSVAQDRKMIAQQLLLFENSGSDDLENITDSQFQTARVTIKVPFKDAIAYGDFIEAVNRLFQKTYPEAKISVTGMIKLYSQTMTNTILSMMKSYVISFVVITLLMILLLGQLRIGLLSMVPNLAPIAMALGLMGWFDLPLSLFTIMLGNIAIGLAVDDTIHFMHNFRRYLQDGNSAAEAIEATFNTAGRAMLVTTCVLSSGFFIYMFSRMQNLSDFGLLTGFTILMALLADFFILPALMVAIHQKKKDGVLDGYND